MNRRKMLSVKSMGALMLSASVLLGCQASEGQSNSDQMQLAYTQQEVKQRGGAKCEPEGDNLQDSLCATVQFNYPEFVNSNDNAIIKKLNAYVHNSVADNLEGDTEVSPEAAAKAFVDEYSKDLSTLSDWQLERNVEILFQSNQLLSLSVAEFSYTGGAHPNSNTAYIVLDKTTAKPIQLADLFNAGYETDLNVIGERLFRQARNIPEGMSLTEAGFWFENDVFLLNRNFAITDKNLLFYFNPYEVSAYAMGASEIVIPIEDIKHLINPVGVLSKHVTKE